MIQILTMPSHAGTRYFARPRSLDATLYQQPQQDIRRYVSMPTSQEKEALDAAKEAKDSYTRVEKEPVSLRREITKKGITFAAQDKLPKLPIPELDATLKKYVDALAPLQSSQEHNDTRAATKDFLENEGKELQERLKKYATGRTSYIEQFWYDSYLNYDNPVVLNLNPFFLLEDDPTPARNNQVTRAASLVISALCFVRAVRKEELPPDTVRGTPLDMYQYSRLFGTARVPTDNGCIIGQDSDSKHIVVMCRGQFYWFDALDYNNDLIMTEKDLAINLQVIVDDAEQTPIHEAAKGAIGVLSTENRKTWSHLRDILTKDEGSNNSECLNIVDSALFVVCLDYTEPSDVSDLCGNMLCGTNEVERGVQVGTCTNRWYDKLQIIVCKNGSAGINFEHTGVDGHTVLRFASDVYTDTILRFAKSINGQAPTLWTSQSPDPSKREPDSFGDVSTTPHKLEWDMITELQIALRFAETRLADLIHQNEFQTLDFAGYGKNFITSMGYSPDAFVQMAFQAAYYGLYGRVENTYEPAMTKMYFHGRTEAIRTVTPEATEFVRTFWADNPPQKKVDALKTATQKHTAITKESSKAQGHDRHLYALYCVWQRKVNEEGTEEVGSNAGFSSNGYSSPTDGSDPGSPRRLEESSSPISRSRAGTDTSRSPGPPLHQMPALFSDAGWDKINNTILSTSNCGNPALRHFGFGPSSGDGFGIGYIIKDDSISVCVSSKHRQTKRFVDSLEGYLNEIRRLLRATRTKDMSAAKISRAREAEEHAGKDGRLKSRGRVLKTEVAKVDGVQTPTSMDTAEVEDDVSDLFPTCRPDRTLTHHRVWEATASSMPGCCCKHSRRTGRTPPSRLRRGSEPWGRSLHCQNIDRRWIYNEQTGYTCRCCQNDVNVLQACLPSMQVEVCRR
jgi:carnitine O-acetyltransferase